ncbi:RdgB/HAM1 family non-canonical purine NTP pyrophosphatase [Natronosalvus halobius]|uniref:RdgB/HAM1 family non-canonical purine NTP pyrophosphatase n=1 Tax=Natronosalvus halobius TaxID=2953746 RepID=UPI0020A09D23|nr:RdgB/HAM1 family non-canonical purine NTP pyrophosphatase [Natronosalvus halobius]USZ71630.1 RdgB/HAM1 family non-canonical purine NTP pyrophosphatase [Natronosalvus halobius]
MDTLYFATGNAGKLEEAREYLDGQAALEQVEYDYTEIQSDDLGEIAATGARETYDTMTTEGADDSESDVDGSDVDGVLVDDTGLFVDALGGFPGPYSAYVETTVGVERVWRLLEAEDEANRRAHFRTVMAYADAEGVETFEGSVAGTIVAPRGEAGFGYDPIFEYNGQTFAEMTAAEKNAISHRGRALAAFTDWYADR